MNTDSIASALVGVSRDSMSLKVYELMLAAQVKINQTDELYFLIFAGILILAGAYLWGLHLKYRATNEKEKN